MLILLFKGVVTGTRSFGESMDVKYSNPSAPIADEAVFLELAGVHRETCPLDAKHLRQVVLGQVKLAPAGFTLCT